FTEEEEEIPLAPTRISPNDVPHQQEECVPGGGAEIGAIDDSYHDVCVSIEEFDEFFQAPEAALQAAQEELGKLIICSWRNILQCDPDDLDDGEDQRAKGKRAGVRDIPERTAEGREEGEGGHVVGFLEGPVVRREGPCQRHLAQCDHEVGEPEEHEDVEELKDDEILVVCRLAPVECEEALGVRAQLGDVARVEGLERTERIHGGAGPVGDAETQQEEGAQWEQQRHHDVTDSSAEKMVKTQSESSWQWEDLSGRSPAVPESSHRDG
uniref:Uncharacterized protein n=1 Tax=Aquila chrysaetos chrysaetos TaxID=223781 RepID=A0A663F5G4_AQUCH